MGPIPLAEARVIVWTANRGCQAESSERCAAGAAAPAPFLLDTRLPPSSNTPRLLEHRTGPCAPRRLPLDAPHFAARLPLSSHRSRTGKASPDCLAETGRRVRVTLSSPDRTTSLALARFPTAGAAF